MIDSLKKEALKKHYEWKGKIETKAELMYFLKKIYQWHILQALLKLA